MLSIAPAGDAQVQPILWQGHEVDAYAGRWIVRVDAAGIDTIAADVLRATAADDGVRRADDFSLQPTNLVEGWLDRNAPDAPLDIVRSLTRASDYQMFALEAPAKADYDDLQTILGRLPGFRYLEPDFVLTAAATFPNDTQFSSLYGLHNTGQTGGTPDADIDAPEAWDLTTGSSDIVVGVIDSGVDYNHVDLAANIWINPGEIPGNGIDDDGNGFIDDVHGWDFANDDNDPMDDNSHGTHVSGTIGAVGNNADGVVGVNWDVQIMGLKFLGAGGSGSTSDAVDAVNYATMMRRDYGINVRMTSNSWGGGGYSQALYDAIAASAGENLLFVAAAGNGGPDNIGDDNDSIPHYPSSYDLDNVIAVASVNHNDVKAGSSNFGLTSVDLAAPGVSVRSTVPGNNYSNFSGTSMATPHVAGVAALAWSIAPDATYAEIRDAIFAGVDLIPAMTGITVTGGRLNARGALEQLGMRVISTSPARDEIIGDLRSDFVIDFSHPYVPGSVDAGDLVVNGQAANSFTLTDANTVTFHYTTSPIGAEGLQTLELADGAIQRASDSAPLHAYSGTFRYDVLPMAVVATVPADGTIATLPLADLQVDFNEPYDPASVTLDDVTLSQGTISGFTLAGNSVIYHTSGIVDEGTLSLSLAAGALTDVHGNPLVPYSGSLTLDYGIVPLPTPLEPVAPDGSQVYDPPLVGTIGFVGDIDRFTIYLEAGQVLSVVADPDATLRPLLRLRDPANTLVASTAAAAPGSDAVLQAVAAATSGVYTIVLRGRNGTTGAYGLEVVLNAAVERESHDGPANDTFGTAQNLNAAFRTLGGDASIAAVVGRTEALHVPLPDEIEPNDSTATANSAAVNFTSPVSNLYQLAASGIVSPAFDSDWFNLGPLDAGDVLTLTMSGTASARGTLGDTLVELHRGNPASPTFVTSNDDGGPGLDSLLDHFPITVSDTYFVRARAFSSGTGTYQLAAWLENAGAAPATGGALTSETEPNDSAPAANDASNSWRAVNHQSHTAAAIGPSGDNDYYAYEFSAGDLVTIVADSTSALDAQIALLSATGTVLASENGGSTLAGPGGDSSVYAYRIAAGGTYFVRVLSSGATTGTYSADVYLSADTPPPAPSAPTDDWYSFRLAAGDRATLVLDNAAPGDVELALARPGGAIDATGLAGATNADRMIHQYVAPAAGMYRARVTGAGADYQLLVLRNAEFDTEPNDSPAGTLVDLSDVHQALGFLDHNRAPFDGPVSFTVDPALSSTTLAMDVEGVPMLPQLPGSLTAHYQGSIVAALDPGAIRVTSATLLDPIAQPGPFLPGGLPADYAVQIELAPGLTAFATFRDVLATMTSGLLPLDPDGHFDPTLTFAFTAGLLEYTLGPLGGGVLPLAGTTFSNMALLDATLEEIAGALRLTIPIEVEDSVIEPNTGLQVNIHFTGQLVGSVALPPPIDPSDYYEVTLAPGQHLVATTRTPFDGQSAAEPNTLDPALELLDASDAVVASDANSAPDGKNALLHYTSPGGGTYKIRVAASEGAGEYVLAVNSPPVLDPIADAALVEGDTLAFTAHASDADLDEITYSLGPGAPAGASIHPATGQFSWTPLDDTGSPFAITVIATDNGSPQLSDSRTFMVAVSNAPPVITSAVLSAPALPKEGDLITLAVTFTDAGILDTHTGLIDWGDGTTTVPNVVEAAGAGSFIATHTYTGGVFDITYTVTDDEGDSAGGTKSLVVSGTGIHEVDGKTVLQVVGTSASDSITISPTRNGRLNVFGSFLFPFNRSYPAAGIDFIQVLGLGGHDFIGLKSLAGAVTLPAIVDGGPGDDTIRGGNGGNVLMGGPGNDLLFAGSLRDILIGGTGADSIFASGGDDILIAGYTSYDNAPPANKLANDLALLDLLTEWNSSRSYNARTANIVNGSGPILGPNGPKLKKGVTVFDDTSADWLSGSAGRDWYFANAADLVLGKKSNEKLNS